MTERKSSKKIIEAAKPLNEKVETALVETGEVSIEVRGLNFQELGYARAKVSKLDEDVRESALRQWYLRFGIKAVSGVDLPRETLDLGYCKVSILPESSMEQLYTYPDMCDALFYGIVSKTHNTEDELDGLDFSMLFNIPTSSAIPAVTADSAAA